MSMVGPVFLICTKHLVHENRQILQYWYLKEFKIAMLVQKLRRFGRIGWLSFIGKGLQSKGAAPSICFVYIVLIDNVFLCSLITYQ